MDKEINYLEEFLFSAQNKIDGLKVYTEPANTDNYNYLVVEFDGFTKKIDKTLVLNYCNIYQKINREELDEVDVEVNPYRNLGKIKEKKLSIDSSILKSEDEVSELLENIVSKVYEKYNFLILPSKDDVVEEINPDNYVKSNYEISSAKSKSKGQNLYSIGFKIRLEIDGVTEFVPFKIYFRIGRNSNNEIDVKIADEFNVGSKSSKINVMTARKFSNKEKAELKRQFDNNEFEKDRLLISDNIEAILNQTIIKINNYVLDFDNSPQWFKDSDLGKYIQKALMTVEDPFISATAQFRYITQTPLPYSYLTVLMKNSLSTTGEKYDIKVASSDDKNLNNLLNICPICSEPINQNNKLVSSNEYETGFIGCESCMKVKCIECDNVWSEKKLPIPINKKIRNKYYYKAGICDSPCCVNDISFGSPLCSLHAKRCFDPQCSDRIHPANVITYCSNKQNCEYSYCDDHVDGNLFKCETQVCRDKEQPNMYCKECKDTYLNTCSYCGKTMCKDCSLPVIEEDGVDGFVKSKTEFICVDCFNNLKGPTKFEKNKRNNVFDYDAESGEMYPKSRKYVEPYGDQEDSDDRYIYIEKSLAEEAYKRTKKEKKYFYYRNEIEECYSCGEQFRFTRKADDDTKHLYCEDCLNKCSLCERLMPKESILAIGEFEDNKEYYCKKCYEEKWIISDLNKNNEPFQEEKSTIYNSVFKNDNEKLKDLIVPVKKDQIFTCPETELNISTSQTKECIKCHQTYSVTNFKDNVEECRICTKLDNFDLIDGGNDRSKLMVRAFYDKKYGDKKKFRTCVSKNMLMIEFEKDDNRFLEIYKYNKAKSKYKFVEQINENDK